MNSGNDNFSPIILLIAPQMGENIGAAARAMHNFGLSELRIVNPRDGWPNEKALSMAANAKPIIESARIYNSTAEAIADCHQVIATTARQRGMNKPETPMTSLVSSSRGTQCRGDLPPTMEIASSEAEPPPRNDALKTAIMFGPERTGLENEEITLATSLLHIPVNPDNPSLNLGQAVNIICYEWFMQGVGLSDGEYEGTFCERSDAVQQVVKEHGLPRSARKKQVSPSSELTEHFAICGEDSSPSPLVGAAVSSIAKASRPELGEMKKHDNLGGYKVAPKDHTLATLGEMQALFDHLEGYLDAANFWNVPEKKPKMWQNIRTSLTRAGLTDQEVQTWHGVFRAISKGK